MENGEAGGPSALTLGYRNTDGRSYSSQARAIERKIRAISMQSTSRTMFDVRADKVVSLLPGNVDLVYFCNDLMYIIGH